MKYFMKVEDDASLRALVLQDLRECGIKLPKAKKIKKDDTLVSIYYNISWHFCDRSFHLLYCLQTVSALTNRGHTVIVDTVVE